MKTLTTIRSKFDKKTLSIFLILLVYITGLLGIVVEDTRAWFLSFTPFTLLFSAIVLLWNHLEWNRFFAVFAIIAFLTGMVFEILGVQTGLIFGDYHYGEILGYKVGGVPLIIGVNWLTCSYCCGVIVNQWQTHIAFKIFVGALLMVCFDYVLEPTAMQMDFWSWANHQVPLLNYIAWYFISLGLLFLFLTLPFAKKNPIALLLYVTQFVFFLSIDLLLGLW